MQYACIMYIHRDSMYINSYMYTTYSCILMCIVSMCFYYIHVGAKIKCIYNYIYAICVFKRVDREQSFIPKLTNINKKYPHNQGS